MNKFQRGLGWILLFACVLGVNGKQARVGIIGGGIGGAATAYYLRKFAKNTDLVIDVYEKNNYIGGRLKHTQFEGVTVELGGDAFSNVNYELMEISKELNIQFDDSGTDGNGLFGVWDGHTWYDVDPFSLKYWFSDAKLYLEMEYMKYCLWRNFVDRGDNNTFDTISGFVDFGGLDYFSSQSAYEIVNKVGISESLVFKTWEPLNRNIYDQSLNCNAFAGFTSMLAVYTDAYTVLGGNSLLVEKMFSKAKANVNLNSLVTAIAYNSTESTYTLTYSPTSGGKAQTAVYDFIVLASPIEHTSNLKFVGFSLPSFNQRTYHHWFILMVCADKLSPSYFGKNPVPDAILTTDNTTTLFTVIAPHAVPVTKPNQIIYKIFSNYNITTAQLKQMFVNVTSSITQHWPYTFPDMSPTQQYQPVHLHNGLYYLNAIESVATAMGASTPAGKNIALLINHQLQQ